MTTTEIAIPDLIRKKTARTKTAPARKEVRTSVKHAAERFAEVEATGPRTASPPAEPAAGKPEPKKPSGAKPKASAKRSTKSLNGIGSAWIESLRSAGHSVSTVSSYRNDLEVAYNHLGAEIDPGAITEQQIAAFNTCKAVMKRRNGKAKAKPTILKTRRALRLALTWAEEQSLIPKAPYSAD